MPLGLSWYLLLRLFGSGVLGWLARRRRCPSLRSVIVRLLPGASNVLTPPCCCCSSHSALRWQGSVRQPTDGRKQHCWNIVLSGQFQMHVRDLSGFRISNRYQLRGMAVSNGVVRWDSSPLCGSERSWLCCCPRCSGRTAVPLSESQKSTLEWTPNPSALSAREGSGLGGSAPVCGRGLHESCAAACARLC